MNRYLKIRRYARAFAGIPVFALVSACATNIAGSEIPPPGWIADSPAKDCAALSGSYSTSGMPAPANALAGYGAVWPAEGSLLSIIERGTNAAPRKPPRLDSQQDPANVVPALRILVDESGRIAFEAKNAKGQSETLSPKAWVCEGGALTTRVALGTENFHSYVQLWKSGDYLIAEQTIRITDADSGDGGQPQPVARFHFRFAATVD